jgi:hypothetical protein
MGAGNANRSGGLDRPSPAKVIADLTKFAEWEPADSPRAITMRDAALALSQLAPRQAGQDPLQDPALHAKSYRIETHPATKELRLAVFRESGHKGVLGYLVLASPEIYDLGTELIKTYDRLEGIV